MYIRGSWFLVMMLFAAASADAQQTIYWKKDHIYNGPGGKEIAIVTPAPADQTAPIAPTALTSSNLTATSVELSWNASTDFGGSELAGYKIYRQQGTGASLPVGTVTGLSFTDQPLLSSTSYTYTVVAFDNAQNHSSASNSVNITTLSWSGETTAPSVPTNLRGYLLTRTSIRLEWNAVTDAGGSGVAGYRVYRDGVLISGATAITATFFENTGLAYKTAYAYTVKAEDGAGNISAASGPLSLTSGWELHFQDDFNRADADDLSNPAYSGASNWKIRSFTAEDFGTSPIWWDATFAGGGVGDFNATLKVVVFSGPTHKAGLGFWTGGFYAPGYSAYFRTINGVTSLYLSYFSSFSNASTETVLVSTNVTGGTGVIRVEARTNTRAIKVYFDDVLKIDYIESDTSRPNSGRVALAAVIMFSCCTTPHPLLDDLMIEK